MEFTLPFVAGLLGSLHCVGMCGAVVLAYSTQRSAPPAAQGRRWILTDSSMHVAYNGGRVLSYAFLGGIVGAAGGWIGSVQIVGIWFSIVAGSAMVLAGLLMLGAFSGVNAREVGDGWSWFRRIHLRTIRGLLSSRSSEGPFLIGLLTPLLPCGLLYSMLFKAAETGSMLQGAFTMLAFGAGIVPALFITGLASGYVGLRLRTYANRLAAATIILMGAVIVMRGAGVPMPFAGHAHHEQMHQSQE